MPGLSAIDIQYTVQGRPILKDVSLEIRDGELVAIMGMSGCGKTTLLKCLAGLLRPTGGDIKLGDRLISGISETELNEIRLKLGLVFQYAALFDSLNVYENVAFGLRNHRKSFSEYTGSKLDAYVAELLERVGMTGSEKLMPAELSGGMRKRVGLARALAVKPEVLLYDEPTSGLDPVMARSIDELIRTTCDREKVTSIIVSHDISSIFRIADRIAMLQEGVIIAFGTPDELRANTDPRVRAFVSGE